MDEAQGWKQCYEALEARMEAILLVFTQPDVIKAVGGPFILTSIRTTASWQMANGANHGLKLGGGNIDLTGYCDADHGVRHHHHLMLSIEETLKCEHAEE